MLLTTTLTESTIVRGKVENNYIIQSLHFTNMYLYVCINIPNTCTHAINCLYQWEILYVLP